MIQVACVRKGNSTLMTVGGRMDAGAASDYDKAFGELVASGEKSVVLDLSNLQYISSMGLASILNSAKSINASGGKLLVCGLSGMVREVFKITGFTSVLNIFETSEAALADA